MSEFLQKIWPQTGNYLVAHPNGNGFFQKAFTSKSDAITQGLEWSTLGRDVYFAVGSVSSLGDFAKRNSASMHSFRSFWIDVDCGEDKAAGGKGYATQDDGKLAVSAFRKALGLPAPIVVNSGYGWHCYWPITTDIGIDDWRRIATKFKAVTRHYGLLADSTRTADAASILRLPDTFNFKRGTKAPVTDMGSGGDTIAPEAFEALMDAYLSTNHVEAPQPIQKPDAEALAILKECGLLEDNYEPSDFARVLENCQSLRYAVENPQEMSEPQWRSVLSVAKFCENGEELIHTVSEGHPDYSENATEAKAAGIPAPHSCETFKGAFDGCKGCTAMCRFPISLGKPPKVVDDAGVSTSLTIAAPMIAPASAEVGYNVVEMDDNPYDYPAGYSLQHGRVVKEIETDTGMRKVEVCPYPIKFDGRVSDHFVKQDALLISVKLPQDGWREMRILGRDIIDPKGGKISAELASQSCIIFGKQQLLVGEFMCEYLRSIVAKAAASKHYAQLGWDIDRTRFVLPTIEYRADGSTVECGISSKVSNITQYLTKRGTLEEWLSVVDTYSREGYEAYAFGHCVGYGSLLMPFTEYEGAIVNFLGDSGSGKSTVLKTINTMFGHPTILMIQPNDTVLARFQKLGVLNNICGTYDEISNIAPEDASNLCLSISQGRERGRLNSDGSSKDVNGTWRMLMATTSNASLYERLGTLKSDAKAEAMRVFEYHIRTESHKMTKHEAEDIFSKLQDNYGHAGEVFMAHVVANQEEVKRKIIKWQRKFDIAAEVPNQERYWSSIVGVTLAGADISKSLGLNNFDIQALFDFAVAQVRAMRTVVRDNTKSPLGLLVEFMNSSVRGTLVVMGGDTENGKVKRFVPLHEPSNRLTVRLEQSTDRCYIDRNALREFVVDSGSDFASFKDAMLKARILKNDNARCALSEGSSLVRSGVSQCWLIDLKHPSMTSATVMNLVDEKVRASV